MRTLVKFIFTHLDWLNEDHVLLEDKHILSFDEKSCENEAEPTS